MNRLSPEQNGIVKMHQVLRCALASGAEPAEPPAPWLAWLTVCLCRYRTAQAWAHSMLPLPNDDEIAHPLPGHPGWSYEYDSENEGFHLEGPRGNRLWASQNADPEEIELWRFTLGLELDELALPEARLVSWLPHRALRSAAMESLVRAGALLSRHDAQRNWFILPSRIDALCREVAAVDFFDGPTAARWRTHLADAEEAAGGAEVCEQFRAWLMSQAKTRSGYEILPAVAKVLPQSDMITLCVETLDAADPPACGKALELLHECSGPPLPTVLHYFQGLDPQRDHPYSAWAAAQYLLARDVARERVLAQTHRFASIPTVEGYRDNPLRDRLTFLLLEYDPHHALPLVRQTLRSRTPANAKSMAMVLGLLDQPWCHRELVMALREGPPKHESEAYMRQGVDTSRRRFIAGALLRSRDESARRLGEVWRPAPPERREDAIGFTHDEVTVTNLDAWTEHAMQRLRPVCERLRGVLPDDYSE